MPRGGSPGRGQSGRGNDGSLGGSGRGSTGSGGDRDDKSRAGSGRRGGQNPSPGQASAPDRGSLADYGGNAISRGLDAIGLGPRADRAAGGRYGTRDDGTYGRVGFDPSVGNPLSALRSFGEFAFSTALTAANPLAGAAYRAGRAGLRAFNRARDRGLEFDENDLVGLIPGVGGLAQDVLASERNAIRVDQTAVNPPASLRAPSPSPGTPVVSQRGAVSQIVSNNIQGARSLAFSGTGSFTPSAPVSGVSAVKSNEQVSAVSRARSRQAALATPSALPSLADEFTPYEIPAAAENLYARRQAQVAPAPVAAPTGTPRGFDPIDFARTTNVRSPSAVAADKLTPLGEITGVTQAYRAHIAPVVNPVLSQIDVATTEAGKQIGEALVARGVDFNTALAPGTGLHQFGRFVGEPALALGTVLGGAGALRGGGIVGAVGGYQRARSGRQEAEARLSESVIDDGIETDPEGFTTATFSYPADVYETTQAARRTERVAGQRLQGAAAAVVAPSATPSGRRRDSGTPAPAVTPDFAVRANRFGRREVFGGGAATLTGGITAPADAEITAPPSLTADATQGRFTAQTSAPTPATPQPQNIAPSAPAVANPAISARTPSAQTQSAPVSFSSPGRAGVQSKALSPAPAVRAPAVRAPTITRQPNTRAGGFGGAPRGIVFSSGGGSFGVGRFGLREGRSEGRSEADEELLLFPVTGAQLAPAAAAVPGGKFVRAETRAPRIQNRRFGFTGRAL